MDYLSTSIQRIHVIEVNMRMCFLQTYTWDTIESFVYLQFSYSDRDKYSFRFSNSLLCRLMLPAFTRGHHRLRLTQFISVYRSALINFFLFWTSKVKQSLSFCSNMEYLTVDISSLSIRSQIMGVSSPSIIEFSLPHLYPLVHLYIRK